MHRKQVYLFDLDGTLTEPGEGITNSVMYALDKFGIHETDREALYRFIGPPLLDSFIQFYGMPQAQAEQAVAFGVVHFVLVEKATFRQKNPQNQAEYVAGNAGPAL